MKLSVLVAGALALLAVPAGAADMPVKAPPIAAPQYFSWSGFYVGVHAGHLWGRARVEFIIDDDVAAAGGGPTNGFVGGALAGWRVQHGAFVFGVEGDIGWTHAHGNGVLAPATYQYDFRWTAHLRAQAGYAIDRLLIFVAGGLASADFKLTRNSTISDGGVFNGTTIGGGFEYAFSPMASGRLEYLYDDFGKKTYNFNGFLYPTHLRGSTVRGALNFKFWNP